MSLHGVSKTIAVIIAVIVIIAIAAAAAMVMIPPKPSPTSPSPLTSPTTTPTTIISSPTPTTSTPTSPPPTTPPTTTPISPTTSIPPTTTPEVSRLITGIGFKDGAWAEYRIITLKSTVKVKMVSFNIKGKTYRGIEMELSGEMGLRAIMLWGEDGKLVQGVYMPPKGIICMDVGGVIGTTFEYKKENIEGKYEVDETFNFAGKDKFRTESGKEVEVFKFKRVGFVENETIVDELWFSPQVPTYYVYAKLYAESGAVGFEAVLVDFGLEGAKPFFSQKDIEICLE